MRMRRIFWKIVSFIFGVLFLYIFRDTNLFKINQIMFNTAKLAENDQLKIVQISDMHNKSAFFFHRRLVGKIADLSPNIIVLTGDLIDRKTKDLKKVFSFLDRLKELEIPTYFITGNHEWDNRKIYELLEGMEKRSVTVLRNEHVTLKTKSGSISLIGIDNMTTDHENIPKAFHGVDEKNFTILLSHSPYVVWKYPGLTVDLILSGHTHGGQIRFPFVGALLSPGGGIFPSLDKGVFEWSDGKYIYVDSGLGTSMIPVRFFNQSQISFIQIKGDNQRLS